VVVVSQHYGRVHEAYGSTADLVRAGAQLMPETTPEGALAALMCLGKRTLSLS
jgi:L-asparaginase/Glu-tRNA(Gln) amidotransferase subunit D